MGLFMYLILSFVQLSLLALDILCFFVIIRMLYSRLSYTWIKAFNDVGGSLVDLYVSFLKKTITRLSNKKFSVPALLNIAMITLVIVRILIVAVFRKLV